jgi:hypothetical protein
VIILKYIAKQIRYVNNDITDSAIHGEQKNGGTSQHLKNIQAIGMDKG